MGLAVQASVRNGWARFIFMQNHYTLLYREEEREMIPLCLAAGVGLLPWSPLARGVLTRPRPGDASVRSGGTTRAESHDYSPQPYVQASDRDVVDAGARVATPRGRTLAAVAP